MVEHLLLIGNMMMKYRIEYSFLWVNLRWSTTELDTSVCELNSGLKTLVGSWWVGGLDYPEISPIGVDHDFTTRIRMYGIQMLTKLGYIDGKCYHIHTIHGILRVYVDIPMKQIFQFPTVLFYWRVTMRFTVVIWSMMIHYVEQNRTHISLIGNTMNNMMSNYGWYIISQITYSWNVSHC